MARIAGIDVPRDKRVVISLTYIFGVGKPTAIKYYKLMLSEDIELKDLTEEQLNSIRTEVTKLEGDLRREAMNIRRLTRKFGSYRGMRHRRGITSSWTKH